MVLGPVNYLYLELQGMHNCWIFCRILVSLTDKKRIYKHLIINSETSEYTGYKKYVISMLNLLLKIESWYHFLHGVLKKNQINLACLVINSKWFRPSGIDIWYNIHWEGSRLLKHITIFSLSFTNNIDINKRLAKNLVPPAKLWNFISYYYLFENSYYK